MTGSILATRPDHPTAGPLLATLDRAGSRWAPARLTARVTADPAARAELRREVVVSRTLPVPAPRVGPGAGDEENEELLTTLRAAEPTDRLPGS